MKINIAHIDEIILDEYIQGNVSALAAGYIAEHLFECDHCFGEYETELSFRLAFRAAAAQDRGIRRRRKPVRCWNDVSIRLVPAFSITTAALAITLALVPVLHVNRSSRSAAVNGTGRFDRQSLAMSQMTVASPANADGPFKKKLVHTVVRRNRPVKVLRAFETPTRESELPQVVMLVPEGIVSAEPKTESIRVLEVAELPPPPAEQPGRVVRVLQALATPFKKIGHVLAN